MGMYNSVPLTEFGISCEPGRTKQAFKDDCDINKIIARYEKTGMIENLSKGTPFYGDVSDILSYQDALEVVDKAESLFGSMSAEIRNRFNNNPAEMVSFLADSKNIEEAKKLGMVLDSKPESVSDVPKDDVKP